jgi:predicted peptidase
MSRIAWVFAILVSSISMSALAQELDPAIASDPVKMFEPRQFADEQRNVLKYRLLKPAGYNVNRKYPLVIFLHGAGERGDDNKVQLVHGMKEFLDPARREKMPCYVVAPQCPTGKKWVEVDWSAPSSKFPEQASDSLGLTIKLVQSMIETAAVDPNRIYITGLSMGGYGTWDAAARHPELFAAAAPICGGGDPETASRFKHIALWAFHGDQDQAVKVERSRQMIEALKAAGGEPKYTEYPGVGHDSWTDTYKNQEFHDWLFAQRRVKPKGEAEAEGEAAGSDQK